MTLDIRTLRPGLLVVLSTRVSGNTSYYKRTIEEAHILSDGELREVTETEKIVRDPDEAKRAVKVRGDASNAIRAVCVSTMAGGALLCPQSNRDQLEAAITKAKAMAAEFNCTARHDQIDLSVYIGEIKADDAEATRNIRRELRALLDTMSDGIRKLDPAAIREAANKAKEIGGMLTSSANAEIKTAIDEARRAARQIVKAGESAAVEVDMRAVAAITEARTAFLDLDDMQEVSAPEETGRGIDLADTPDPYANDEPQTPEPAAIAAFDLT